MKTPIPYAPPQAHGLVSTPQSEWPAHVPGLWKAGDLLVAARQAAFPLYLSSHE